MKKEQKGKNRELERMKNLPLYWVSLTLKMWICVPSVRIVRAWSAGRSPLTVYSSSCSLRTFFSSLITATFLVACFERTADWIISIAAFVWILSSMRFFSLNFETVFFPEMDCRGVEVWGVSLQTDHKNGINQYKK